MNSLETMFAPHSIAIIGASRRKGTLGRMFFDAVRHMNFSGSIYPVNPKSREIDGIECYPDVSSIPAIPDLAVILIGKDFVLATIKQLATKNVKNVVVVSAGFKETGSEGAKLEAQLIEHIRKYEMRLIGPNSMGLFNTDPAVSLNATFSPTPPTPGHVAFISQSGALGVAVLELSKRLNLGFSVFVSTGNKADVGDVDVLEFAAADPNTKVIAFYQESIDHPSRFRKICQQTVGEKPVLVLKAGRTQSGLRAATSHTGALTSDENITAAFLRQCSAIRCFTLKELLHTALVLDKQSIPQGNRVAVVTNAGGPGILTSDALEDAGLTVPDLSEQSLSAITKILPAEAGICNPVDMIASATHETYQKVCAILASDENIDAILFIIVKPPVATTPRLIIQNLSTVIKNTHKPFFCVLMADVNHDAGIEIFQKHNVPVFHYPEDAAVAIGNMCKYRIIRNQKRKKYQSVSVLQQNDDNTIQAPFEMIMQRLLHARIHFSPYIITDNVNQAVAFQQKEHSIALKVINEQIIHKSDEGLVRLNLHNPESVRQNFTEIFDHAQQLLSSETYIKILVQKMVSPGIEVVLGATHDPTFGPVVMFGMGGTLVELYKDVTFRVLPVDKSDADSMITEIKAHKLFTGYRGKPAINFEPLSDTILNFGNLILEHRDIIEMDLNPLIIPYDGQNPIVVDARMTITS